MLVLHGNWTEGRLRLWAESLPLYLLNRPAELDASGAIEDGDQTGELWSSGELTAVLAPRRAAIVHPFAMPAANLAAWLESLGALNCAALEPATTIRLRLPCDASGPRPSDRLSSAVGLGEQGWTAWLEPFEVACVPLSPGRALDSLLQLEMLAASTTSGGTIELGHSIRYWFAVARFILDLLADQRVVPTIAHQRGGELIAQWQPWLHDEAARRRAQVLLGAMPAIIRAVDDKHAGDARAVLNDVLTSICDACVRDALIAQQFGNALDGRDGLADPQVAWLGGLLRDSNRVDVPPAIGLDMVREIRTWIGQLDDVGDARALRLCLRLNEPIAPPFGADNDELGNVAWRLSLHLITHDDPPAIIDAEQIWNQASSAHVLNGSRISRPHDTLLAELSRASRLYSKLDEALANAAPEGIDLTTAEAYEFLREYRSLLEESGVAVQVPLWWDEPSSRLSARLLVESEQEWEQQADRAAMGFAGSSAAHEPAIGLNSIVKFRWQIAVGDQPLTMDEFQKLAKRGEPLVRIKGRWIEIQPQDMASASKFLAANPAGEMTALRAIRIAHGAEGEELGLPVVGLDATGWLASLFPDNGSDQKLPAIEQPGNFNGELRPYQLMGLRWLYFLDHFGLGACLADDMGLGKTIQLIALLLHERGATTGADNGRNPGPTLLVVPTSVVTNWTRELERFAPSLKYYVHHGPQRPMDERFVEVVRGVDVVITTYALMARDLETLNRIDWHRVALDEAQYIKNPPTKQAVAIRSLRARHRVALTGTPVENRLSELWSIMEFCNPGYMGSAAEFRRQFALPVERHRDRARAERLRRLVRPFVLRRLKTDPKVIDDLPQCLETREYATLTAEQAAMYQKMVDGMLAEVDRASGIHRRGLVLATLVKLKQLCDHPGLLQPDVRGHDESSTDEPGTRLQVARRSGKCRRLIQMLEEVIASGGKALIFTQFRQMGQLLASMIAHDLDCETLLLHGGTPQTKRQVMIDRFQSPDGNVPVFVLSLKAGGVGLNLTAANHVFHFDRWWNPAVENQATDRAFRIGQLRNVHVHKFVCVGTLEERIDQMIEQKTQLAENIIGSGEDWLTELSTGQLRDLLTLRQTALEMDA